ncbi:MAG: SH3 domain-containing protein, partial [Caldilineae bacterium]
MKAWMYTPLLSVVALLLLAGCAAPPGGTQPFPLLNAALTNSPPPELQAELRAAEERLAQRNQANVTPEESASAQAPAEATSAPMEEAPAATAQPAEEAPAEATPAPAEEAPAATAQPAEEAPAEQAPAEATPTSVAEAAAPEAEAATVTVRNARVNIRQGPGLNYAVLTTAPQGTTFTVLGRSPDGGWWRICCIQGPDDAEGSATAPAWISNVVVTASAAAQDAPTFVLLPDDLQAEWAANYQCLSDRC